MNKIEVVLSRNKIEEIKKFVKESFDNEYFLNKDNYYEIFDYIKKLKHVDKKELYSKTLFFFNEFIRNYKDNFDYTTPLKPENKGKPSGGFEFTDYYKGSKFGYGIYHAHISNVDSGVIVWYPCLNNNFWIEFMYITHPTKSDNYKKVIKEIYDSDFGFNNNGYFKGQQHLIKENFILNFFEYLKFKRF